MYIHPFHPSIHPSRRNLQNSFAAFGLFRADGRGWWSR